MRRACTDAEWFEGYQPGDEFLGDPVPFREAEIISFARMYDPQSFHIDPAAAKASPFNGLIASGTHSFAAVWGGMMRAGFLNGRAVGAPGMDIKFLKPVRPGDTLIMLSRVTATKISQSRPDRGFVSFHSDVTNQVLVLHGTTGSGASMLTPAFAGELFGPGQPLDANRYFIILPDAIGTGKSTKPSDGLRANFPKYNYDDMVDAQFRLVREHLGVRRLRLAIGNSMGGMQVWNWAQKYADTMDIAVPMASLPTEMSGRNWMMRRLIIDSIRNDPEWMNGNYTKQPRSAPRGGK